MAQREQTRSAQGDDLPVAENAAAQRVHGHGQCLTNAWPMLGEWLVRG